MLLAFKLKLGLACAAGLAGPLAVAPLVSDASHTRFDPPALVELKPATMTYRMAGDFTRNGRMAGAPNVTMRIPHLGIMQRQVSGAEYQACVDDHACRPLNADVAAATDRPAVQVSWHDAAAYADWLSRRTGDHYRLPTDEEWAFAAGSRFKDDGVAVDADDPSRRWLSRYEREANRGIDEAQTRSFGSFGRNENGLDDLSGNVWEWTATCFARTALDETDHPVKSTVNCGVRVVEGAHRAYVTDFIRDARAGGCASGAPPTNLGFRLVREQPALISRLSTGLRRMAGA